MDIATHKATLAALAVDVMDLLDDKSLHVSCFKIVCACSAEDIDMLKKYNDAGDAIRGMLTNTKILMDGISNRVGLNADSALLERAAALFVRANDCIERLADLSRENSGALWYWLSSRYDLDMDKNIYMLDTSGDVPLIVIRGTFDELTNDAAESLMVASVEDDDATRICYENADDDDDDDGEYDEDDYDYEDHDDDDDDGEYDEDDYDYEDHDDDDDDYSNYYKNNNDD